MEFFGVQQGSKHRVKDCTCRQRQQYRFAPKPEFKASDALIGRVGYVMSIDQGFGGLSLNPDKIEFGVARILGPLDDLPPKNFAGIFLGMGAGPTNLPAAHPLSNCKSNQTVYDLIAKEGEEKMHLLGLLK